VVCFSDRKNLCWNILQAWNEVNEGDLRLKAGEEVAAR
jgi:hypothetical protein